MATVVVGVDFSPPSKKALDAAVALAKPLGATLVLVHASAPPPPGTQRGHSDPITKVFQEVDADEVAHISGSWAKEAAAQVKVEVVTRIGRPVDVVLAEARARKAAYVVVGTHGRGLRRAVLGSVAEAIVHASHVPVLVVPA